MNTREYLITPVPAPRMTRSDKWKKRDCVMRYFRFRDEVRLNKVTLEPFGSHVTFFMPMAKSWSRKKRAKMLGVPHQQKPDVDNLCKALLDALFDDDAHVFDVRITKVWSDICKITISENE